ncbi:hypothetical protein WA026_014874 [Henosepilachna vigintioctopunctata]|uniref:Uncharacterized protein n=1 Tax=Henosepilachna vigintioctopunctata TaxID=420089 RepID=A0AAW1UYX1_9CUCU
MVRFIKSWPSIRVRAAGKGRCVVGEVPPILGRPVHIFIRSRPLDAPETISECDRQIWTLDKNYSTKSKALINFPWSAASVSCGRQLLN